MPLGDKRLWEDVLIELERFYHANRDPYKKLWAYYAVAVLTILVDISATLVKLQKQSKRDAGKE